MRARTLSAAVLAAGLAFAPPTSAAGPQVVDKADDANALNDNSPAVLPVDNPYNDTPTPVGSTPSADILSVQWRSLYERKKLVGYTVTMVLKAPPTAPQMLYRATSSSQLCSALWLQYYSTKPELTPQASLRAECESDPDSVVPVTVRVEGRTLVWTVDLRDQRLPDQLRPGTKLVQLGGNTRGFVDNPECAGPAHCTSNAPQYDTTRRVTATFTIGK